MGDRAICQKSNDARGAALLRRCVLDRESARQHKIAWHDIDYPVAQIQMGNALRPMVEPEEGTNGRQVWSNDPHSGKGRELPVASVVIMVLMRVHDEQRKSGAVLQGKKR